MSVALGIIVAALACYAWLVEPAQAGPVVGLVVGLVGLTGTAAAVATSVISIGIGIGASYLASKLFKPKAPDQPTPNKQTVAGLELDIRIDADVPQNLIVGTAVTAGSLVYAETYGYIPATDTVEEIRNSNLIEVVSLADHPISQLLAVYVEGQARALTDTGTDRGYTLADYGDKLGVRIFYGSQTAADPFTVAALGSHSERPWTSTCIGTGISYARQHSVYDQEKVPGRLQWKYVVQGIKLYDPRKDTTVGGSGSHRFDDLDTHEFTANLAVISYNVLRGIRVKNADGTPVHFYGLENTPAANLPLDNWFAAMNECDVVIDGEPQFHGGGETGIDVEPHAFIQELLKACDGRLTEVGGIYKLHVGAPELPVISITDEALRADESDPFKPILPLTQRINYVTGKFTSPADGWVSRVAPPRSNATWEAADGRRLPADLDAPMVQSDAHMQRLMQQMMRKARQQRRHVIPLGPGAFGVEPGDTIEWTSDRNGYIDKVFRVDGVDVHPNLNVTLAVTEEDPEDYDWNGETDLIPTTALPLAINRPAPKVLDDFSAEPYILEGDQATRRPAILVTWTPPEDGDINGVGVQVRRPVYPDDVASHFVDEPESGQAIIAGSLAPNTEYEVRARFRSFNGWPVGWSLWIPVTTPDVAFTLEDIEIGIRRYIEDLESEVDDIRKTIQAVAAAAGEQDAANILQRARERGTIQSRTTEFRTGLADANAAITTVEQVAADNEAAIASLTTTVSSNYGTLNAAIETNATAISTNATAISSLTTTVTANYNALSAAITVNETAIADNEAAISSLSSTVSANYGTLSASIATNASAIATLDGYAAASYSLKLDVNNYVVGYELVNGGSGSSAITFNTDYFQIAKPGVSGGSPTPVFTVGTVDGVAKVGIRGDIVLDGTLTTNKIAAGAVTAVKIASSAITTDKLDAGAVTAAKIGANQVTAGKIAAGAVNATNIIASNIIATGNIQSEAATAVWYVAGGDQPDIAIAGYYTLASVAVNIVVGPVLIQGWCQFDPEGSPAGACALELLVDGAVVESYSILSTEIAWQPLPLVTSLSTGGHTVALRLHFHAGASPGVGVYKPRLSVLESRR